MIEDRFAERLIQLRLAKGVSARDMSLTLGQSEAYINRIENKKMLPSMSMFFYMCDYFQITPREFFDFEDEPGSEMVAAIQKLSTLSPEKRKHILAVINDL